MVNVKSKPCPFCGSSIPGVVTNTELNAYRIVCRKCFIYTDWFDTEEEALAAWNTRAELEAENERLRKAGYEIGYHDAMKAAKRGGTLTAEQVSKATYAHSIHADCADADWQAIADELNAELGSERERALEELVRDMWREMLTCPDYVTSPCMTNNICERVHNLEIEVNR